MIQVKKRRFKTIWEVVKAAQAEIEKHRANPTPDLRDIKQQLKEFRQIAGHLFNVEHPSYKDVESSDEEQYELPLGRSELEEVYGNALFNTLVANYLSAYIQELEELEAAPAHEC